MEIVSTKKKRLDPILFGTIEGTENTESSRLAKRKCICPQSSKTVFIYTEKGVDSPTLSRISLF
jgi:hypothetical protein